MTFIRDEAEKFGGIQHFCLREKIRLLQILWCPIHKSSEKLPFNWKTMYNRVIGNLNSEQLFWAWSENPKLKHLGLQNLSQHTTQYLFNSERVHKFIWWWFLLQIGAQKRHPTQKILIPSYQKLWMTFSINTETLSKGAWLLRNHWNLGFGKQSKFQLNRRKSTYCVLRCLLVMKRKSDIPRIKYVTNWISY